MYGFFMEIQLWRSLLEPYELAVKELILKFEYIRQEHRAHDLYSPIEQVSGRVKSVSSILEKMHRTGVPMEEMEESIRSRKIVIVGGHDNWTGFLREKFPSWSYIRPGASNTIPESAVMQADHLFFFTDTISHGAYNKFLNVVRTHSIPFGYLHGTNIPATIRQIYEAVTEKD